MKILHKRTTCLANPIHTACFDDTCPLWPSLTTSQLLWRNGHQHAQGIEMYWVLNNCIPRCFYPQLVQVQLAFLASFSSLLPFSIQTPRPVARLRVVSEVAPWSTLIPWYLDHKLNSCFLSYHAIPRIYSWRCSMLQETRLCSAFQVSILFLVQCCWCLL